MKGWLSWVRREYFDEEVAFGEDVLELVGFLDQLLLHYLHRVHLSVLQLPHQEDLPKNSLPDHAQQLVVVNAVFSALAHLTINILDSFFLNFIYRPENEW